MKIIIVIYYLSLAQTLAVSLLELDTGMGAWNTLLPLLTYTLAFSVHFVGEEERVPSILVCDGGSKWFVNHGIDFLHLFEEIRTPDISWAHTLVLDTGQALGILSRETKGILVLKKQNPPILIFSVGWPHCLCHLQVKISSGSRWWLECRSEVECSSPI